MMQEEIATKRTVAIKKVKKDAYKSGVNLGALKELHVLHELAGALSAIPRHPSVRAGAPHVLALLDTFSYGDRMHLVLEYGQCDLAQVTRDTRIRMTEADVKAILQGILRGVACMHACHFMHRDLKGVVKLADFGHAARFPDGEKALYHRVVTIWYRAPELLLASRIHGPAVDMWSVGCIFGEMLLRAPMFAGDESEVDQLAHIFRLCGTPVDTAPTPWAFNAGDALKQTGSTVSSHGFGSTSIAAAAAAPLSALPEAHAPTHAQVHAHTQHVTTTAWPDVSLLRDWAEFEPRDAQPWRNVLTAALVPHSPLAADLLGRMLVLNPSARISAAEALEHPWFSSEPWPTPFEKLPMPRT